MEHIIQLQFYQQLERKEDFFIGGARLRPEAARIACQVYAGVHLGQILNDKDSIF